MPRVLVVTYPWLPAFSGGVKLAATLCRYLPEAGWDPTILSRDWSGGPSPEDAALGLSFDLGESLPSLRAAEALPVIRTGYGPRDNRALRLRDSLAPGTSGDAARRRGRRLARGVMDAAYPLYGAYPDAFRGWEEHAVAAGITAVRQYGMGAIVSFSSPATAHIVAGEIARQAELPWIPLFADLDSFRLGAGDGRTTRRRLEHRVMARRWLRGASRIAAITPEMLDHLQAAYDLPGDTIAAPFDPEERRMPPRRTPGAPVRLVHVGRMAQGLPGIALLADALDLLLHEQRVDAGSLRVELVGSGQELALHARLDDRRAGALCTIMHRVAPAESLRMQREADVLLLMDRACGDPLAPPALSLPELLGARRPVLHVSTGGGVHAERLLAETGAGTTVTTARELATSIGAAVDQIRERGEPGFHGDEAAILRSSGVEQARRLAGMLDGLSVGRFGSWQRV